jgi:hypothetical protein
MAAEAISGSYFVRIDSDDIQRFPDLATAEQTAVGFRD